MDKEDAVHMHNRILLSHERGASQVAQVVKSSPAMQETQETRAPSLGREGPLEEGMETHSGILACRIPWTEEPGELQSVGCQRVGHN